MVGPWGWWWTVQCLVGGWKTVIFSMEGGPYWVESCLTSSLIIFMIGCGILSVSLLMTHSWEEWLTDGMVAIQRDLTGWRSGLTGTSASTAKSCNWWGRAPHTSAFRGPCRQKGDWLKWTWKYSQTPSWTETREVFLLYGMSLVSQLHQKYCPANRVFLPLCSALVKSHLISCIQLGSPGED